MIFQIVSTHASTMSIIDSEERAFWPSRSIFILRSSHVEDDWNSILIIVSLDTLMGIRRVACDQTMGLRCKLSILKIFKWIKWLVRIPIDKKPVWLKYSFHLGFNNTIDTYLLIFNFSFNLLNHWVILAILIWQALLELSLGNLLLVFLGSFLPCGTCLTCATRN